MRDTIESERAETVKKVVINLLDISDDEGISIKTGIDVKFIKNLRESLKK